MRLSTVVLALSFPVLAASASSAAAETTRTLRLEHVAAGRFMVENLAGTMRVTQGPGDKVVAVATVHAESDELADSLRLEQVNSQEGIPTLRVIYPTDRYTTFHYPREGRPDGSWLAGWFGGSSTNTKYAGRKIKVSDSSGVLLYADVEVQLPRRAVEGTFRNLVGAIHAQDAEGKLLFDASSGGVTLDRVRGEIEANTGSGDVKASGVEGSFKGNTGSGEIDLAGFQGEAVACDTGSGDVNISSVSARSILVDTGSGDVTAVEVDAEDFKADTGSGDVTLEATGGRLASVTADTGSGDVTLRLGPDAAFEALAELGSGDIRNRYSDARPILKDQEVIGYRRGDARIRIAVDTGSGSLLLEPGR